MNNLNNSNSPRVANTSLDAESDSQDSNNDFISPNNRKRKRSSILNNLPTAKKAKTTSGRLKSKKANKKQKKSKTNTSKSKSLIKALE